MAEYYPLLSKAVGSLPNSTPETRRLVYERARKALIGQLRTLHPPIPDEDVEKESVELDRAIARLEDELASPAVTTQGQNEALPSDLATTLPPVAPPAVRSPTLPPRTAPTLRAGGALGPSGPAPFAPLRTKVPVPKPPPMSPDGVSPPGGSTGSDNLPPPPPPPGDPENVFAPGPDSERPRLADPRGRFDAQRPIAPQPPSPKGPKRQMWIIWVGVGVVALIIAGAAFKLRDNPQIAVRKPVPQQAQTDNGKIAERVGNSPSPASQPSAPADDANTSQAAQPSQPTSNDQSPPAPASTNPAVPVAQRAALLMEAPDEPNKVKTFLGTVVWKLNNVAEGQGDPVGTGVEADVDMPDDKLKAVITFAKNTDASLPASHTIKVHFDIQPASTTGDVKQISVPQMRKEDSPSGEPLAGVTVPVVQNTFLVGLSPGNAETANLDLLRGLQWIDVPMLLANGKIAKLTFEKGAAGDRDISDAIAAWQKQ